MQEKTKPSAQEIQAQAAVDQAANGSLPKVGEYTLQYFNRQYRISFPPVFVDNFAVGETDDLDVFVDFEQGMVVYSFGGGSE